MSGTMSRSNINNPWLQFHENNQPPTVQNQSGDTATDHVTTVISTTPNHSASNQLNRVTRPTINRRRSRASRKTPTTLLNTDTTNFRAMVQRFTGGGNNGDDVTSTHQVSNTYNVNTSSSSFSDGVNVGRIGYGVPALRPNKSYQPYFTVVDDGAGGSATPHNDYDDQHMGFRQTGSFNW